MTQKTYSLFRFIHTPADYEAVKKRLNAFYQRAGIQPDELLQLLELQSEVSSWERHYGLDSDTQPPEE